MAPLVRSFRAKTSYSPPLHVIPHPPEKIVPCCATAKQVFLDSGLMFFGIISINSRSLTNEYLSQLFYVRKARIIFIALLVTAAQPGCITTRVTSHGVKMAADVDSENYSDFL